MEAEWYRRICLVVDQACPHHRRARQQFGDHLVLKVYFWAVLHGRPVNWACVADNWPDDDRRPGALPSQPTMSRRLRTVGVRQALERTHGVLADRFPPTPLKQVDSKPLVVGNYTKDSDARRGRGAGEMAHGYKLHALRSGGVVRHWTLASMNVNDQVPARDLLARLAADPLDPGWGYVTGDNQYDANPVHAAAAAVNHQMIAPPRKDNAEVRDARRNTPGRLRSLELCANPLRACGLGPSFGLDLLRERKGIERTFGHLVMLGLHAPPPWVRRPGRTAAWVAAMLVIQMVRLLQIKGVAA
jgi:hypothetical protein